MTLFPRRLYVPYFQTWSGDGILDTALASGTKFFKLAFLEGMLSTPCSLGWNGKEAAPIAARRHLADIQQLRAIGGDVIFSFGGGSAAEEGREIADACHSAARVAAAYRDVVTIYEATWLDMDIEGRSLASAAGVDRRNHAIRLLQDWVAAEHRSVRISYTLPATPDGLTRAGLAVLESAVAHGARVDRVNAMAFDYFDGITTDMSAAAVRVANGVIGQLRVLYPARSDSEIRSMVGLTLMPGIDDDAAGTEVTTLDHVRQVQAFAREAGLGSLSMWAIQRDNGSCPGIGGSDTGSGLEQGQWDFSRVLETFTGA
jgi:chitinase